MAALFCTADYPYLFIRWGGEGVMAVVKCNGCGLETSIYHTGLNCDEFFDAARQSEYGMTGERLFNGVHVDYPPANDWLCAKCDGTLDSNPHTTFQNWPKHFTYENWKKCLIYNECKRLDGRKTMNSFLETLNDQCLRSTPQEIVQRSYAEFRHKRVAAGYRADEVDIYIFDLDAELRKLSNKNAPKWYAENLIQRGVWNPCRTIEPSRVIEHFTKEQKEQLYHLIRAPVSVQWARAVYAAFYFKRDDEAPPTNDLHRIVRGAGRFPIRRRLVAYLVLNRNARKLLKNLLTIPKYSFPCIGQYGFQFRIF